jgi:hypothetical protein
MRRAWAGFREQRFVFSGEQYPVAVPGLVPPALVRASVLEARAYYDHRRAQGDSHHKALRALANRLVGILHGCLEHHTLYDEHTAWATPRPTSPLDTYGSWGV